ncbi:MAG: PilZ domain-containing protein [Desulfamplus sp.]|nr:PilZ domain-containing protein [Desulfamplus sp.]
MLKGYVDENNKSVFLCPHCGFEKHFDATPFKNKKKSVTIKCKCGTPTEMYIEFRKDFRKDVELYGTCVIEKSNKQCDIVVKNISRSGIRIDYFIVNKKDMSIVEKGDVVTVEFRLDDRRANLVKKKCVVRLKMDGWLGLEFLDNAYEKEIGFYMW